MPYVYSTLSNDNAYTNYAPRDGDQLNEVQGQVLIKGGSGVADKHLITRLGVMTEVSPKELEILEANADFKLHTEKGFIQVRDSKVDPEVAVTSGMESRDASAPMTEGDVEHADGMAKLAKDKDEGDHKKKK